MVLSRLKVSGVAVRQALMSIDLTFLSIEKIELLKNASPLKEEVDLYLGFPLEDPNNYAITDLFFSEIC